MPSMTDELGRLASAIATSRRQRAEARSVRGQVVVARGREVEASLEAMAKARNLVAREQQKDAAAARRHRHREVATLFRQFGRVRAVRWRQSVEAAAAEQAQAAAFMRDLTARVAALRDGFAMSQEARSAARRARAHEVTEQLAGYARDRHGADLAWRGMAAHPGALSSARTGRHRAGVAGGTSI